MMRRYLLTSLAAMATFLACATVAPSVADAMVVSDQGHEFGVALTPGTSVWSLPGVNVIGGVNQTATQCDPWLSPDLVTPALSSYGLCWHGGPSSNANAVMHANETFALTWDPLRRYFASTRGYMEQFLRDVADGSGTLTSPYAVTTQYRDAAGLAANKSLYGGGCIDYGSLAGDFTCQFANAVVTGTGQDYPNQGAGCSPAVQQPDCVLTDADIRSELSSMVDQMGLSGRIQPGYTPQLDVLLPSNVQVCLDSNSVLCSVGGPGGRFCSYHSSITIGTTEYPYVVQPWSAFTNCDEPDTPDSVGPGGRMVEPLSRAQISAITNPWFDGWYSNDGFEITDDGCAPDGYVADAVKVAGTSYSLAPEFSNAGVLEYDPGAAPQCALNVTLGPAFVVPSPIDAGEVVGFDGSVTHSSLMVASTYPWTTGSGYSWDFGDGRTATGPSVVHSFARSGFYKVTLTVTDRGDNVRTLTRTVEVLGPDGQPPSSTGGNGGGSSSLLVSLQLLPQSLRAVLHQGLAVRVRSNQAANGFATLSIFRSAAHRARLSAAGNPKALVVIGRGTVAGIKNGTVRLHVRVSSATARKLSHTHHLTLTLHLTLYAKNGGRTTASTVGHY
jgi:PKD domain